MSGEYKTRFYVAPSALASYFGCGFNSPEEQFELDSGQAPTTFDEDSKLRMALGVHLEDSVINYFQDEVFKTPITDRNTELKEGYDGKIKYKIDGMINLDKPTIFENKVSNSQSGRFTDEMGYIIQVHAYMLCEDKEQAILAGLYQGRPIWKLIKRDEELINDIKEMVDFVVAALTGLKDFYKEFPVHLLEKYSKTKIYEPITSLSPKTVEYLHKVAHIKEQIKTLYKELDTLEKERENGLEIEEGVYEDDVVKVRVSSFLRKPAFNLDKFREAYPHLDLSPFYDEPTEVRTTKYTLK